MTDEKEAPQEIKVSRDAAYILEEIQKMQDIMLQFHDNMEVFFKLLTDIHKKVSNPPMEESVLIKPTIM